MWKLGTSTPVEAIELPLEPETVYYPLRKFFDEHISDGVDFPQGVDVDTMSFCVLLTIYAITPDPDPLSSDHHDKAWIVHHQMKMISCRPP